MYQPKTNSFSTYESTTQSNRFPNEFSGPFCKSTPLTTPPEGNNAVQCTENSVCATINGKKGPENRTSSRRIRTSGILGADSLYQSPLICPRFHFAKGEVIMRMVVVG